MNYIGQLPVQIVVLLFSKLAPSSRALADCSLIALASTPTLRLAASTYNGRALLLISF